MLVREDPGLGEEGDEEKRPEAGRGAGRFGRSGQTILISRLAFVPPKPNEFDKAAATRRSRAAFGV